jgi:ATP synthase protein I
MATPDPASDRARRIQTIKTIGALSTVGLSFVLAIVIGVAAGVYLDRRLGTSPWLFLLGFVFGLAAGVLNVVRTSRKFLK